MLPRLEKPCLTSWTAPVPLSSTWAWTCQSKGTNEQIVGNMQGGGGVMQGLGSPHLSSHFPVPSCSFLLHIFLRPSIMLSPLRQHPPPFLLPYAGTPTGSIRSSSLSAAVTLAPRFLRCHAIISAGGVGGCGLVPEVTGNWRRGRSQCERAPQPRAQLSLMVPSDRSECRLPLKSLRRGLNNQTPGLN